MYEIKKCKNGKYKTVYTKPYDIIYDYKQLIQLQQNKIDKYPINVVRYEKIMSLGMIEEQEYPVFFYYTAGFGHFYYLILCPKLQDTLKLK